MTQLTQSAQQLQHEFERFLQLSDEQTEKIKREAQADPCISQHFPLTFLELQYEDSRNFQSKIISLTQDFGKKKFRQARRDGSCFYRSFIFRLAEIGCSEPGCYSEFKLSKRLEECRALLLKARFEKVVFEEFEGCFLELIRKVQLQILRQSNLESFFNQSQLLFDYCVMFLRLVISAFIQSNQALFDGYFESKEDLVQFCLREVEPIDSDADHIQITSLFKVFQIPMKIFYVDNSPQSRPSVFALPEEGNTTVSLTKEATRYRLEFLYVPGHYCLLY